MQKYCSSGIPAHTRARAGGPPSPSGPPEARARPGGQPAPAKAPEAHEPGLRRSRDCHVILDRQWVKCPNIFRRDVSVRPLCAL